MVLQTSGVHEGVLQAPWPQASKPPSLETVSKQLQKITIFKEKTKVFYFVNPNAPNGERSEPHFDSIDSTTCGGYGTRLLRNRPFLIVLLDFFEIRKFEKSLLCVIFSKIATLLSSCVY